MGKFILGLIIGAVIGVLVMTVNPNLPEELRIALTNLTAQVMRGAEQAAESVGEAADDIANQAEQATGAAPEPVGPTDTAPEPPEDLDTAPEPPGDARQ